MTAPVLRDYQVRAINEARGFIAAGRRAPCIVAPTGAGKTLIGATISQRALARSGRVLWLTHRQELIDQTVSSLKWSGVPRLSVLRADDKRLDKGAPMVVASIQTLIARRVRPDARVVVLDEAHHYRSDLWGTVAEHYKGSCLIGLTATPERSDGSPLGDLFDSLVVAANYSELIASHDLVPCDVLQPPERLRGAIARDPIEAYNEFGDGRSGVIFTSTVEEAKLAASKHPKAASIDASMPARKRKEIISAYASGELTLLCNCYLLCEGWDAPRAEVAVLARGCVHASTYLQIAGRILRPSPATGKKKALLIDLSGASLSHGMPTDDRVYSLTGTAIRAATEAQQGWTCPFCGCALDAKPETNTCPECGENLLDSDRTMEVTHRPLELIPDSSTPWICTGCGKAHPYTPLLCQHCGQVSPRGNAARSETVDERFMYFLAACRTATKKNYKPGWVACRYKGRYGEWPPREWRQHLPAQAAPGSLEGDGNDVC